MKCILTAVAVFFSTTAVFFSAAAEESERELFNQLYQDIISASDGRLSTGDTSGKSVVPCGGKRNLPGHSSSGGGMDEERLRQEIEKMVDEAKLRHDDAVRFMLDN